MNLQTFSKKINRQNYDLYDAQYKLQPIEAGTRTDSKEILASRSSLGKFKRLY